MGEGEPRRIGIIGAMDIEVDDIVAELEHAELRELGPAHAWLGELAGVPVAVVRSGVGKGAAAAVAQALVSAVPVRMLINTGVAGALDPVLSVGDVVVSTFATYHDVDVSVLHTYPRCCVPGFPRRFKADGHLVEVLARQRAEEKERVLKGGIASGDRFVNDAGERAAIRKLTKAACCEMEGTAVAQVAWMNDLPFVVCRAISDTAEGTSSIDYAHFEPLAASAMAKRLMRAIPALA